ncbi:MAG: thioredoxin-like domain-containing protein [Patescibacteria group bacterium]|jgi:thiol-disulfide isomerase/thioredoxin
MALGDIYAPDFPKTAIWFNSKKPLFLEDLKGQVVLLDFWTYCCINCLHVLPDLKYLENKYKDQPFLVIGVHSAKFYNEQNIENIESAIERYEINHPVVVDNNHIIWESFGVNCWPSFVLIDSQGRIRGITSGEEKRLLLDTVIGQLLEEGRKEDTLASAPLDIFQKQKTQTTTFSFPGKLTIDDQGKWLYVSDTNHNRVLVCRFKAYNRVQVVDLYQGFNHPQGLCLVKNFLYVCDTDNHLIKRIDLKEKHVETIAGTGEKAGFNEPKGEGLETALNSPWDVDYAEGYLYIAMAGLHQIWSLSLKDNLIEVFAGSGLEGLADGNLFSAQLAQPSGISIYEDSIYFADSEASALRKIDLKQGDVQTLIGSGLFEFGLRNGAFEYALLQHPLGLFADKEVVYLADTYNNSIRLVDLKQREITTLIGQKLEYKVCVIEDRDCQVTPLWEPTDVYKSGKYLYIADSNNHLIRGFDMQEKNLFDLHIENLPLMPPDLRNSYLSLDRF